MKGGAAPAVYRATKGRMDRDTASRAAGTPPPSFGGTLRGMAGGRRRSPSLTGALSTGGRKRLPPLASSAQLLGRDSPSCLSQRRRRRRAGKRGTCRITVGGGPGASPQPPPRRFALTRSFVLLCPATRTRAPAPDWPARPLSRKPMKKEKGQVMRGGGEENIQNQAGGGGTFPTRGGGEALGEAPSVADGKREHARPVVCKAPGTGGGKPLELSGHVIEGGGPNERLPEEGYVTFRVPLMEEGFFGPYNRSYFMGLRRGFLKQETVSGGLPWPATGDTPWHSLVFSHLNINQGRACVASDEIDLTGSIQASTHLLNRHQASKS